MGCGTVVLQVLRSVGSTNVISYRLPKAHRIALPDRLPKIKRGSLNPVNKIKSASPEGACAPLLQQGDTARSASPSKSCPLWARQSLHYSTTHALQQGTGTAGVSRTRMGCPEGAFCAHIEERETLSPRGKGTENAAAVAPRSQDRQARQETTGAAPSGNEEGAPPRGTQRKAARPRGDDDDRAHRRRQPGPSGKARHEAPLGPGEATLFCASCGSSPKPSEKGMSCPSRAQREPRTPKAEQGAVRPRPTNTRGQQTGRGREPRAPNRCIAKLRQPSLL